MKTFSLFGNPKDLKRVTVVFRDTGCFGGLTGAGVFKSTSSQRSGYMVFDRVTGEIHSKSMPDGADLTLLAIGWCYHQFGTSAINDKGDCIAALRRHNQGWTDGLAANNVMYNQKVWGTPQGNPHLIAYPGRYVTKRVRTPNEELLYQFFTTFEPTKFMNNDVQKGNRAVVTSSAESSPIWSNGYAYFAQSLMNSSHSHAYLPGPVEFIGSEHNTSFACSYLMSYRNIYEGLFDTTRSRGNGIVSAIQNAIMQKVLASNLDHFSILNNLIQHGSGGENIFNAGHAINTVCTLEGVWAIEQFCDGYPKKTLNECPQYYKGYNSSEMSNNLQKHCKSHPLDWSKYPKSPVNYSILTSPISADMYTIANKFVTPTKSTVSLTNDRVAGFIDWLQKISDPKLLAAYKLWAEGNPDSSFQAKAALVKKAQGFGEWVAEGSKPSMKNLETVVPQLTQAEIQAINANNRGAFLTRDDEEDDDDDEESSAF